MRNMDLVIPQELENELAGIEERGAKPPIVRIPGKTHLSTVLLSSNPWEQRDLDRKLHNIQLHRTRKIKSLESVQRQFFTSQIFDTDYTLRFTKDQINFADPKKNGIFSIPSSACSKKRNSQEHFETHFPKIGVPQTSRRGQKNGGLGIFAPSLSARENEKVKQSSKAKSTPNLFFTLAPANMDNEAESKSVRCSDMPNDGMREEKSINTETPSLPPISEKSERTTSSIELKNLNKHTVVVSRAHFSKGRTNTLEEDVPRNKHLREPVLHKASSLPMINIAKFEKLNNGSNFCAESLVCSDEQSDLIDADDLHDDINKDEELCHPEVIKDITKTLPMSLMIKANQNVNKKVYEQKQKMIRKCKRVSERDLVSDPRYIALQRSLIKPEEVEEEV